MSTPSDSAFDLSTLQSWRGLKPGMPRVAVVDLLNAAGLEDFDDEADPEWMLVHEWGMELQFSEDGHQPLVQLSVDDPQFHWSGRKLVGEPLHLALETIGDGAREAGWRPENAVNSVLADREVLPPGNHYDEHLLASGTLWLPVRRLGLVMSNGRVHGVVWRDPANIPLHTVGPVNERQLEISRRPDATNYLRFWRPGRQQISWLHLMANGCYFLAMVGIIVYSIQENHHWNESRKATATVVAIDRTKAPDAKPYQVEFIDEDGRKQTAGLDQGQFYIPPREIGETVEVRYRLMQPIRVKGPAGQRDAAFVSALPRVMIATGIWGAVIFVAGFLKRKQTQESA